MIKMDEMAWRQGYAAGIKGSPAVANPYFKNESRCLDWLAGFSEGRAERFAAEQEGRPLRLPDRRSFCSKGINEDDD
jgi:ribosome modulation factor